MKIALWDSSAVKGIENGREAWSSGRAVHTRLFL